ncbi:MAG: hypothetical protein P8X42_16095 [Calditrichaceae bacterium]
MRYLFTPSDKTRVRLFANSFEAVVFWIAAAGLLFLAMVSIYRAVYLKQVAGQYNDAASDINPVIIQIRKMIAVNDSLEKENRKLQRQINAIGTEVDSLKSKINEIKIPAQPEDTLQQLPED